MLLLFNKVILSFSTFLKNSGKEHVPDCFTATTTIQFIGLLFPDNEGWTLQHVLMAIFLHPCVGDDQTNGDGCI